MLKGFQTMEIKIKTQYVFLQETFPICLMHSTTIFRANELRQSKHQTSVIKKSQNVFLNVKYFCSKAHYLMSFWF